MCPLLTCDFYTHCLCIVGMYVCFVAKRLTMIPVYIHSMTRILIRILVHNSRTIHSNQLVKGLVLRNDSPMLTSPQLLVASFDFFRIFLYSKDACHRNLFFFFIEYSLYSFASFYLFYYCVYIERNFCFLGRWKNFFFFRGANARCNSFLQEDKWREDFFLRIQESRRIEEMNIYIAMWNVTLRLITFFLMEFITKRFNVYDVFWCLSRMHTS